jgi:hypothetical protein
VHLLFFHDSQDDEAVSDSFPFPFVVPFLLAILNVMSLFTRIRSGAEEGLAEEHSEEEGTLSDYYEIEEDKRLKTVKTQVKGLVNPRFIT